MIQTQPVVNSTRRIKTEEKAKVVASVWEEEIIQVIAPLRVAVLHWTILIIGRLHLDDLKENDEFILFFKIVLGKIASTARNILPPKQKRRPLPFLLSVSFFYEHPPTLYPV